MIGNSVIPAGDPILKLERKEGERTDEMGGSERVRDRSMKKEQMPGAIKFSLFCETWSFGILVLSLKNTDYLNCGSTDSFCKGPDRKYFRFC